MGKAKRTRDDESAKPIPEDFGTDKMTNRIKVQTIRRVKRSKQILKKSKQSMRGMPPNRKSN